MILLILFFISAESLITENDILSFKDITSNNLQVKCSGILDKIKIETLRRGSLILRLYIYFYSH